MPHYFLKMIRHLRQQEETMLYSNMLVISEKEADETIDFLRGEYEAESLDYPYEAPEFCPEAALWAAKTIYIAAQLLLYRENKNEELATLLPDFPGEADASAMLSADLCLRFLPDTLFQLRLIDSQDLLIEVLESKLHAWHYSGIHYGLDVEKIDLTSIASDLCLQQLYVNRIISGGKMQLAMHPAFTEVVKANLGIFAGDFWSDFKTQTTIHE